MYLERSRFDFKHESIEGVDVYVAGEIQAKDVLNSIPSNQGWVRLMFKHGPIVGIDLQSLKATKEKQSAFVHHLALSMLPPLLTSIVDIDAMWVPAVGTQTMSFLPVPKKALQNLWLVGMA